MKRIEINRGGCICISCVCILYRYKRKKRIWIGAWLVRWDKRLELMMTLRTMSAAFVKLFAANSSQSLSFSLSDSHILHHPYQPDFESCRKEFSLTPTHQFKPNRTGWTRPPTRVNLDIGGSQRLWADYATMSGLDELAWDLVNNLCFEFLFVCFVFLFVRESVVKRQLLILQSL